MFYDFLTNVAVINQTQRNERVQQLMSAIGYMINGYKAGGHGNQVLLLVDSEISEGKPQGGSGKGMICDAIAKVRKVLTVDGKSEEKRFMLSAFEHWHDIIQIDDPNRSFRFDSLFSAVTNGANNIEKKGVNKVARSHEDSPKYVIPTNYIVDDSSRSVARRLITFELSEFYSSRGSDGVYETHNARFWSDDWNEEDWAEKKEEYFKTTFPGK